MRAIVSCTCLSFIHSDVIVWECFKASVGDLHSLIWWVYQSQSGLVMHANNLELSYNSSVINLYANLKPPQSDFNIFNSCRGSKLFFIFSMLLKIFSSSLTRSLDSGLVLFPRTMDTMPSGGSSASSRGRILSPNSYFKSIFKVWNSGKNSSQHWFQLNHREGFTKVPLFWKEFNSAKLSHRTRSLTTRVSPKSKAILSRNSSHKGLEIVWDSRNSSSMVLFWLKWRLVPKGL